jgi:Flp pilus assembly pilin Flp
MFNPILRLVVAVHVGVSRASARLAAADRGQSTVEYALVLGAIAALVTAAFTLTGGSVQGMISTVISKIPGLSK